MAAGAAAPSQGKGWNIASAKTATSSSDSEIRSTACPPHHPNCSPPRKEQLVTHYAPHYQNEELFLYLCSPGWALIVWGNSRTIAVSHPKK